MKGFIKLLSILFLASFTIFIACKEETDDPVAPVPTQDEFKILADYLVENDMDLPVMLDTWITPAPALEDVNTFIADNYIIDIRTNDDFKAGHIEGAVNTALADVLTTATNANGKPIVVVCYTGQTAGHAVIALRLNGYTDARVLKFGMSGWNPNFDKWTPNTGDMAIGHNKWGNTARNTTQTFEGPNFDVTGTDGPSILQERITLLLAGGLRGIKNETVLTSPDTYFINNFWDETDVTHYGIIDGAYRIKPLTVENGEIFKLDPSKTVVTYCWTGQTSSMVTAYLYVLGFDAQSLKFGVNGMIYSDLESHKFSAASVVELPVVTE